MLMEQLLVKQQLKFCSCRTIIEQVHVRTSQPIYIVLLGNTEFDSPGGTHSELSIAIQVPKLSSRFESRLA